MWYSLMLTMVEETSNGSYSAPTMLLGQSEASKLIDISIHLWCGAALGAGTTTASSRRKFLMMRWEVMSQEPLNILVVTRLRVRMAINSLEVPFSFLEPHSVLLVLFRVCRLFALSLVGRCTITVLLLQLLVVLFHELLDLPALLDIVAR
jgi:hypothetical protein